MGKKVTISGNSRTRIAALAILGFTGFSVASMQVQTSAAVEDWMTFGSDRTRNPEYDTSSAGHARRNLKLGYPTLSSDNIEYTKAAIQSYAEIVEKGGWPKLPHVRLKLGMTHPAVALLRQRLQIVGDLQTQGGRSETFDSYVEKALKAAQIRHGLKPTGVMDEDIVNALNVPASAHLRSLRTNLARIRRLAAPEKGRYILANIAAAQVEAIEDDRVVSRHTSIVGKPSRQTPILESKIEEINFNKEWILPPTIIREDLLPKAQGAEGYKIFEDLGIDVYADYDAYTHGQKLDPRTVDWKSPEAESLFFAQPPGRGNPLGFMKINFFNSYAVFMHDTPSKTLFSRNHRAKSSGCIRIQNIERLAAWLLRDSGWDQKKVLSMKRSGETLNVPVRGDVKLYFAYVTAWATQDGMVYFRRDIYDRDKDRPAAAIIAN